MSKIELAPVLRQSTRTFISEVGKHSPSRDKSGPIILVVIVTESDGNAGNHVSINEHDEHHMVVGEVCGCEVTGEDLFELLQKRGILLNGKSVYKACNGRITSSDPITPTDTFRRRYATATAETEVVIRSASAPVFPDEVVPEPTMSPRDPRLLNQKSLTGESFHNIIEIDSPSCVGYKQQKSTEFAHPKILFRVIIPFISLLCILPGIILLTHGEFWQLGNGTAESWLIWARLPEKDPNDSDFIDAIHVDLKGSFAHCVFSWTASLLCFLGSIVGFLHFRLKGDIVSCAYAVGLFARCMVVTFHTLATSRLIMDELITTKYFHKFTMSMLHAHIEIVQLVVTCVAISYFHKRTQWRLVTRQQVIVGVSILMVTYFAPFIIVITLFTWCGLDIPKAGYNPPLWGLLYRPFESISLVINTCLLVAVIILWRYRKSNYFISGWALHVYMAMFVRMYLIFFCAFLFDTAFNVAHFL
eukprot:230933_1